MKSKYPLDIFVHRTLIYRLITVAFILSILFGTAGLVAERNRVNREMNDIVTNNIGTDKISAISRASGYRAMIVSIVIVFMTTATIYPVILRLTRRISKYSAELLNANLDTLETLGSAVAVRDNNTNAHNYRVSIYATRLGEKAGLSDKTMRKLIKGSFLHDVGKIGIPDEILLKSGKLNEAEYERMKNHVESGEEIIRHSDWLKDAAEVILAHHERISGDGYPLGLSGDKIPITARIFTIADVFDALTSDRPYKEALSFKDAMKILEDGKDTHFDSSLVDLFKDIARPLHEKYGGREDVSRQELVEIINNYFYKKRVKLEY